MTDWNGNDFRPFCSERCRMIDFGAWIDEEYAVPDKNSVGENEGEKPMSQRELEQRIEKEYRDLDL